MTEEEYLKACGWELWDDDGEVRWTSLRRLNERGTLRYFTLAEAVALQVAEDRARYNFVRERSWMSGGMLVPSPIPAAAPCPTAMPDCLFAVDAAGKVYARRNGEATVRLSDGVECTVAVVAGDTLSTVTEEIRAALDSETKR